ncbi:sucrose nonfermenting 4 [Micractinium conductrix]|uniref:Sucrose nonfermenting 4 n=1 Tax=Micractinium conductrix TaxID=554055 RepID=A0A2P6VK20_9CHLO|nr:sucrose nonfermenting 4 [Micractinium conductrix]|eukprot:PSC74424.1 sucrose nonfermenting 4 [Micractinium conductrix]
MHAGRQARSSQQPTSGGPPPAMSFFVPTKFVWRFGGNQVHLCGSFTRWVETVPMTAVDGQLGTFTVVVHLPPGYHQYKFIVDGEWRHDESQPFMPDPLGNVNNWLFVRKPEGQATPGNGPAGGGLHQSLQQQAQQQQQAAQQQAAQQQHVQQSQHQQAAQLQGAQQHAAAAQHSRGPGGTAPSSRAQSVADMEVATGEGGAAAGGVIAPIAVQADEPAHTKRKIAEFLNHHSAYELIPESGKVVLLDADLPMRQAFHALHEQGIASAPLWDGEQGRVMGMLSASDFIHMLQRLRSVVSSGVNPMSEAEMDQHTIRSLREELEAEGVQPPRPLVAVHPNDSLSAVVRTLFERGCSMAPVLATNSKGGPVGVRSAASLPPLSPSAVPPSPTASMAASECPEGDVLHTATISGVLACLMRHFRASLASLPLLAQPLSQLPIGTWAPTSSLAAGAQEEDGAQQDGNARRRRRRERRIAKIACVRPETPLTQALGLLLEAGVSSLPVVDAGGALLDIYARADITTLAKGNAYARLQFEDVTVGQALSLGGPPLPPPQAAAAAAAGPPQWGGSPRGSAASLEAAASGAASSPKHLHLCTPHDALRTVVERLSVPGVRRLVVVDSDTRRVEGIISLSDVASYLLL